MSKSFLWRQKTVGSPSKDNYATKYIFKKSISKCCSGCVGGSFWPTCRIAFQNSFSWLKNQREIWLLLEKTFFLGIFLCARWMQTCHKKGQKSKNNPLKLWEKLYKQLVFSKNHFMGKRLLSRRLHVWQPCGWRNRQKSEKLLARKKVR